MANIVDKNFKPNSKEVRYLSRDFDSFKQSLIEFAKQYYPRTYKDFNPSSPGMMYIDMASYVGDVLSFYIDYQFKEGLLQYAEERKNVINLAKFLGYSPRPIRPSIATLDVFQIVPSKVDSTGDFIPDLRYALNIKEGMELLSSNGKTFITSDSIDFSIKSELYPREDTVYSRNSAGEPEFFLIKKSVKVFSGKTVFKQFSIEAKTPNLRLELPETDVIKILSIKDEDNNTWHQVDYLAQDLIQIPVENNVFNFESFYQYKSTVPNILKFLRTNRRFIVEVDENNKTYIQFGSSTDSLEEEIISPNSELLGVGFSNVGRYNLTLDPTSFVKSNSYGSSPYDTTLTVRYITGGGIDSNVNVNEINRISKIEFNETIEYLPAEQSLVNLVKNSLYVSNPSPATGGAGPESVIEIKQNALLNFAAQNRAVTRDDYMARVLSMPAEFGKVSKVYVTSESDLRSINTKPIVGLLNDNGELLIDESNKGYRRAEIDSLNPLGINLYLLTYDDDKKLVAPNQALIYNLKKYLSTYKMLSDRINLIDGYVINIGVNFTILTYSTYNKKEVLKTCIDRVKEFFEIDNWQFCQPINLSQLELEISKIEGVQSVSDLTIYNIVGDNYSICEYDIKSATKHKIIYPPIDPAIFEVKYPNVDIKGKCL